MPLILSRRIVIGVLASVLLTLLVVNLATAQRLEATADKTGNGEGTIAAQAPTPTLSHAWSDTQWKLAYGVWVFSGVLFVLQFAVMFVSKEYWTDRQFKAFALTLILNVGLLLIIAGYTDSQIAPMMGLIGTIVGYVLGSPVKGQPTGEPTKADAQHAEPDGSTTS